LTTRVTHIASALLVIFQLTLFPFNALHHHAEDEHLASILKADSTNSHHCELDDFFCQPIPGSHCEHGNHLQREITKCFTCQFHFVSSMNLTHHYFLFIKGDTSIDFKPYLCLAYKGTTILLLNKGPPQA